MLRCPVRIAVAYRPGITDGRATALAAALAADGIGLISAIRIVDIHIVAGVPVERAALETLLADGVASSVIDEAPLDGAGLVIEVTCRPGVHDPASGTLREVVGLLAADLPASATLQTARQYRFRFEEGADPSAVSGRLADALHNPLVQQATAIAAPAWERGARPPERYPAVAVERAPAVDRIDVAAMDDAALARLSDRRLLALSAAELAAIRSYAADFAVRSRRQEAGIGEPLTDVELEMLAQTWSEHCKHKIFNAVIDHTEDGRTERIASLFDTYIRRTTAELDDGSGFLKSVFSDDSGVIRFDERTLLCFKAETHNAPSALDPYGGAITGIVGVNRDIIGTGRGAKPIFNTDVLCFAPPSTPEQEVPAGLMHPRRVLAGVHRGIVDGGNQSGIPVVAGAFLFDPSFVGKPLVFCGTGGMLPAEVAGEPAWQGRVLPGDLAVMVGGRIGKDGIHGATFSSLALDDNSPTSAVQIGDPIVQRRVLDLLLEARDAGLFHGITDNGAGGLSSSLGEMARESGGVSIDLDAAPLKYPGLAPWEILLSESQERMSLAVPPGRLESLRHLAVDRGVELSVVGRFTDDGLVTVRAGGGLVASLDLEFLHDGVPRMRLRSAWEPPPAVRVAADRLRDSPAPEEALLALLAEPNVTSKESLVRQYDHEVRAGSVVKPFCGVSADGPTDGAVVRPRYDSYRGVTVTHGICPWLSQVDPYVMAMCAVDEAVRAHVACGGDPDRMAALDNFCWPDPVESGETPDGRHKLGQLVRAARGLRRACLAYRLPLISGKDSMKNDAYACGRKISVLPTLLVSLIGIIPDVRRALTTDFKRPGDLLFLVGATRDELRASTYDRLYGGGRHGPDVQPEAARDTYRALHAAAREGCMASCHDLSDGGLAVALAECTIGGRLGARVRLERLAVPPRTSTTGLLFGESPSRLLVSVPRQRRERFLALIDGLGGAEIGEVSNDRRLHVSRHGRRILRVEVARLAAAWSTGPVRGPANGDGT